MSTALSANSLEPIASAAICVAVIVLFAIFAAVTFKSVIEAVTTALVPNVPIFEPGIAPAAKKLVPESVTTALTKSLTLTF